MSDRVDISRRPKIAGVRSVGVSGFSLFEVVLAVALSAIVMVLIGMAIDICLTEFDSGRAKVEQAQLARAIFSHLEDDLQHVLQYTPQDIQSFRQLAASQAQSSEGESSESERGEGDGDSRDESSGGLSTASTLGTLTYLDGSASAETPTTEARADTSQSPTDDDDLVSLPPGIYGTANELMLDRYRMPRLDRVIVGDGSSSMPMAAVGDLQMVHYFLHGVPSADFSGATISGTSGGEVRRGLYRQQIDGAAAKFARENGDSSVTEAGIQLLAPEVAHLELEYFDGASVYREWDMRERSSPPLCVRVHLWVRQSSDEVPPTGENFVPASLDDVPANMGKYSRVIRLPMAGVSQRRSSSSQESRSGGQEGG